MGNLIELNKISYRVTNNELLKEISFEIKEGEFFNWE